MKFIKKNLIIKNILTISIICCTFAAPAGVFAEPTDKAVINAKIKQVKDNLLQITEAATLWEKARGCSIDCLDVNNLIAAGKLAEAPQIPSDISPGDSAPYYSYTASRMGSCGPNNIGAQRTFFTILNGVSEQFCRAYNESVGLGSVIIQNCATGGNCSSSGSSDPHEFPVVNSSSFCFLRTNWYAVIWTTPLSASPCYRTN